ncbi:MAG: FecR domain-containing protein, partial [Spirochaetaceae bacterium]|nr:FecR domain-containing protein [Spirochaetaceae bacterium]
MKKKRSTRSRAKDLLVTLLCLSGATISLWLFWKDFTAVLEKLNDTPIATVTWKYKAAQRKFSDRLIWDRLQQDSLVYNGDTIRTAAGAETTVTFEHSELQLGENTIIQIQVDTDGMTSVNLSGGNLSANASSGSNMQLRSGNVTVALQEGTAINANIGSGSASPLSLQVTAGSATISGANGTHAISQGEGLSLDAEGAITSQPITIIEPAPQTRLLKFEGRTLPVPFKWATYNLPPNSQLIFETATDKDFNQLVDQIGLSGISTMSVDFEEGSHYWRLYAALDGVPVEESIQEGRITVLDAPTPTSIVPMDGDSFTYRSKLPTIRFMWNGNEYVSSYLFEIADNPQMNNPVVSQNSVHPSSIVSSLGAGQWYWRITPYYTFNGIGYGKASETTSFTIIKQGQLQTPQPISPVGGQLVNIAKEE